MATTASIRKAANPFKHGVLSVACLSLLLATSAHGIPIKRALRIETTPANTTIEILVVPADNDPKRAMVYHSPPGQGNGWNTGPIRLATGDFLLITATAQNFESRTNVIRYEELKNREGSERNPYVVRLELPELRREVAVDLQSGPGTQFYVDGNAQAAATTLAFVRENGDAPWKKISLKADRPLYQSVERSYTYEEVAALPAQSGRRQLQIPLVEIERPAFLKVTANEAGARVLLDGKAVGSTPADVTLSFTRPNAETPWSSHQLRVEKEEYEYRPLGELLGQPAFVTNLTFEAVRDLSQKLNLPDFQPVRFFQVPMYRFAVARGEAKLLVTNSISAKDPNDTMVGKLLDFGGNPRGEPLIVGRLGATLSGNTPGKPGEVVLALPVMNPRQNGPAELVGSQVYLLNASGSLTPVTEGEPGIYDFDPCITKDRKTVYYSSDRGGQRGIWKKGVSAQGVSPIDPGRGVDVEPSVFTTSEGVTRVAFSRYLPRAAVGSSSLIVVQEEDRLSFAETRRGRCPAWSNDGTKIAYISPDNKVCVMDSTGENERVLTRGKSVDDAPAWLPGDRQLIYASAVSSEEARLGTGNYDLWRVDLDGNTEQVVANPSYDGMPAVTSEALVGEGKQGTLTFVYFLSNRGAQRTGADPWKIHYFELK